MFSVIIPLYNKEEEIVSTINSVLNQTFQNFEIIVVNDGSTDKSKQIVQEIANEKIRIIDKSNGGVSSARNLGISNAQFDYLAFIDGDDIWSPGYLEEMYELIEDFPDAALYGCEFNFLNNGKYYSKNSFALPKQFRGYIREYFKLARKDMLFWTSSSIVRKKCIFEVGGFDERIRIGEDLDVWIRLAHSFNIVFFRKVLAHYNQSASNRAMKKRHKISDGFLFYSSKYFQFEKESVVFKFFINDFRCRYYLNYLNFYEFDQKLLSVFTQTIDRTAVSLKWRVFLALPIMLKIILAKFYYTAIIMYLFLIKKLHYV